MTAADFAVIRRALEALPAACRYHGTRLESDSPRRDACCDTGRPSRLRRDALTALDQAQALLASEKRVCEERGSWLAEVDAALTRAGEDEGGGYIAYQRRVDQLAARARRAEVAVKATVGEEQSAAPAEAAPRPDEEDRKAAEAHARYGYTIGVYFPPQAPWDVVDAAFDHIADHVHSIERAGWDGHVVGLMGDQLHVDHDPAEPREGRS